MKTFRKFSVLLISVLFLIQAVIAYSQEKQDPLLVKAIGQYKHENYEEALATLKELRNREPASTIAAYYAGLTYKQMQDYKNAIAAFRDAVTYEPKIKGALVELIDCLGQTGDIELARKWIDEAERENVRPAQVAFLKGLILMKDGKAEDAVEAFNRAELLDPSMKQAADYQIGIADIKLKRYGDAKSILQQVIVADPGSNMSNYANEYINAISSAAEAQKPLKIQAGLAWEYDTNVVLMPDQDSVAVAIADQADSREVTTAQAEYTVRPNDMIDMKGQYSFYWAKQNNLGFYDTVSNTFILQPTIYFEKSLLTFPCGYAHMLVNDKAYLSQPIASAMYNFMAGKNNMGQIHMRYFNKDFLWTPSSPDENRDSNDLGGSFGWYYFFDKNRGFINARYGLNKEETKGNNWDYVGNRATVALLLPSSMILPTFDKANLTISGDALFENFLNTNSIYFVQRRDQVYTVSALAAYKFYKDSEIRLQYTYVRDNSNISVYMYTRMIYSAGVNVKF